MNTSFEKSKNSTDEWYTPKEIRWLGGYIQLYTKSVK